VPDERLAILTAAERRFLGAARRATLATTDGAGRPRLVPACFVLADDDEAGRPLLYSPLDAKPKRHADPRRLARVGDILARPAVTLLVDRWEEDWSRLAWLRVHGLAELIEPDDDPRATERATERATAIAALRAKYSRYCAHDLEARPLIRITLTEAVAWGDLGPEPPTPAEPSEPPEPSISPADHRPGRRPAELM